MIPICLFDGNYTQLYEIWIVIANRSGQFFLQFSFLGNFFQTLGKNIYYLDRGMGPKYGPKFAIKKGLHLYGKWSICSSGSMLPMLTCLVYVKICPSDNWLSRVFYHFQNTEMVYGRSFKVSVVKIKFLLNFSLFSFDLNV